MMHVWDDFVASSRNGTFIVQRRFMDYHADRFHDDSLMLYDNHDRLLALLPATGHDRCVSSHAGLTYGGWILGHSKPDAIQLLDAWKLMTDEFRSRGYDTLIYKPVPHIYHKYPSEEDLYVLFRSGAVQDAAYASSVIDLGAPLPFNAGARRHVKRARAHFLTVEQSTDFKSFWPILTERLGRRYGVKPVHTLAEIELLYGRFRSVIKLWLVRDGGGRILAGTVLFLCGRVVKAQYIASTQDGRDINAVDFMFDYIVKFYTDQGYRYLDLGHSCEDNGRFLNIGLITQKCGYGARTIVQSIYTLQL